MLWRRRRRPEPREPNVGASVYRRRDHVFVLPIFDHSEAGEPAVVLADVAPAELGELVLAALARSRAESVERADIEPLLRAARVRSYGGFVKGTTSVHVDERDGAITVTRLRNMGPRGGFAWTDEEWEAPFGDAQRLGESVIAAFDPGTPEPPAGADDEPEIEISSDAIEETLVWIDDALSSSGYDPDLSPRSLREIDRFFEDQLAAPGDPVPGGLLAQQLGARLFGLGVYVGEVIRLAVGGEWGGGGEIDLRLELADGSTIWPVQRVMKRYELGAEESLVAYGAALGARADRS